MPFVLRRTAPPPLPPPGQVDDVIGEADVIPCTLRRNALAKICYRMFVKDTNSFFFSFLLRNIYAPGRAVAGQLPAVTGQPLSVKRQLLAVNNQILLVNRQPLWVD